MIAAASMSCRGGGGLLYDRVSHGSTSTTSPSSCTSVSSVPLPYHYPREPLNPPPSLCTSEYSTSERRPRVVTPCSTEVCEDADAWRVGLDYETEPLYGAPPPTPYSRCADDDTSSLGWYDSSASMTRCSYDECERHQHTVTRATSPAQSYMS